MREKKTKLRFECLPKDSLVHIQSTAPLQTLTNTVCRQKQIKEGEQEPPSYERLEIFLNLDNSPKLIHIADPFIQVSTPHMQELAALLTQHIRGDLRNKKLEHLMPQQHRVRNMRTPSSWHILFPIWIPFRWSLCFCLNYKG